MMRNRGTLTILALLIAALAAGQSVASAQEGTPKKARREVRVEGRTSRSFAKARAPAEARASASVWNASQPTPSSSSRPR